MKKYLMITLTTLLSTYANAWPEYGPMEPQVYVPAQTYIEPGQTFKIELPMLVSFQPNGGPARLDCTVFGELEYRDDTQKYEISASQLNENYEVMDRGNNGACTSNTCQTNNPYSALTVNLITAKNENAAINIKNIGPRRLYVYGCSLRPAL